MKQRAVEVRIDESLDRALEAAFVRRLMKLAPGIDGKAALAFVRQVAGTGQQERQRAEKEFTSKLPPLEEPAEDDLTARWPAEFERRGSRKMPSSTSTAMKPPAPVPSADKPAAAPKKPTSEPTGRAKADKTIYKIYGKKGGKPVHTRLKGRAFIPSGDSKFKPGMQARLAKGDGDHITVSDLSSDHSQHWVGFDEGLKHLIRQLVEEALMRRG